LLDSADRLYSPKGVASAPQGPKNTNTSELASLSSSVLLDLSLQVLWSHSDLQQASNEPWSNLYTFLTRSPLTRSAASEKLIKHLSSALQDEPDGELSWPASFDTSAQEAADLLFSWSNVGTPPHHQIFLKISLSGAAQQCFSSPEQLLRCQQFFINQLIHEIRTPLAITSGSIRRAGILFDSNSQDAKEHISVAQQEVIRMRRLIDHLSMLTDVETGSRRWKFNNLPFGAHLRACHSGLPLEVRERLAIFSSELMLSHNIYVASDALLIVLANVLDNAARYSEESSPILFVTAVDRGRLHLYVADWGFGISSAQRDSIFDPFRRLEEHRDPSRADGSGLGLSVSRSLLGMMNSTISLLPLKYSDTRTSPATVVRISLPLFPEHSPCASFEPLNQQDMDLFTGCAATLPGSMSSLQHADLFLGLYDYLDRCGEPVSCPLA
jgi:signal transduction histidine kinase